MKQTVYEFALEFALRKQFKPELRHLKINRVKDLKAIKRVLSN